MGGVFQSLAFGLLHNLSKASGEAPGASHYQTDTDDLETKDAALKAKLAEIQALLHDLDDAAEALHEKNKKALTMLHGLLDGSPNEQLLDQIPKGP